MAKTNAEVVADEISSLQPGETVVIHVTMDSNEEAKNISVALYTAVESLGGGVEVNVSAEDAETDSATIVVARK